MMTITEIKELLTQTPPLLTDVQSINADLPDIIGDSLETDGAEDIAQLVHIAKLALAAFNRLSVMDDKAFNLRQELINLATKCIERADWIGPFDETDPTWMKTNYIA